MDRALNRDALAVALGDSARLPTPAELQNLIAQAEVNLFIHQPRIPDTALAVGWYLHGIASAPAALDRYSTSRQRQAFQVSAHILDLALRDPGRSRLDRCRIAFGAAVGYARGEMSPNAMAVYRHARETLWDEEEINLVERLPVLPFQVGLTFLGLEMRYLRDLLTTLKRDFRDLAREVGVDDVGRTAFGTAYQIVEGAERLRLFLAGGAARRLDEARELLRSAAAPEPGTTDLDARWVAAHLQSLADENTASSVWTGLPPYVPRAVKQALVFTDPPIATLWPPQRELFGGDAKIFAPTTKRVVMSLPTSAGKTLVAQILALTHLATAPDSVCYVAPMRSLGREVRNSLRPRLRVIQRELPPDLPDFLIEALEELPAPSIDVMTPERLGHLLRHDADGVLNRYGMFIFDEAHLVADPQRGFGLEWVLALLNWKTRDTDHRLVLLSAALGNSAQVMSWMSPNQTGSLFASEWRGPRRLHAVFYTDPEWDSPEHEAVASVGWPERVRYPLRGRVQLRPAEGLEPREVAITEPIGSLAFRVSDAGVRERHPHGSSTSQYIMNARIVAAVGHAGPVLVVMSTRVMARQMARAVAALVPSSGVTRELTAFVQARLGEEHPLVPLLPHRVAYHHAGLPTDVLEALEEALRAERLMYLTATTTLTEGVNLPVRTVVVAETRYEGQDPGSQILGARLINAMGRAGRATKETEGWVVICKPGLPGKGDFDRMRPADEDLTVTSRLATEEALEALAVFEEVSSHAADAVFAHHAKEIDEFISFVWLLMAGFDELNQVPSASDLDGALQATLGFQQLDASQQARWREVAIAVRGAYYGVGVPTRRRWAQTGTSLPSARLLDEIGADVATQAEAATALGISIRDALTAIDVLDVAGGLSRILELRESPSTWEFRPTPNAKTRIAVEPGHFLREWIGGAEISDLATKFLADVENREFAIEQIVDTVSGQCEHYLAWTLRVVLDFATSRMAEHGVEDELCPDLPLFVRYGVNRAGAVSLITSGLRSRAFAQRVAEAGEAEGGATADGLQQWLQGLSIEQWRDKFGGTAGDLLDLLEYTRSRGRGLLGPLLSAGFAETTIAIVAAMPDGPVDVLRVQEDDPPQRVGIFRGGEMLGEALAAAYADLAAVIDSGLEFRAELRGQSLRLSLIEDAPAGGVVEST
jgi:hypothetical protein